MNRGFLTTVLGPVLAMLTFGIGTTGISCGKLHGQDRLEIGTILKGWKELEGTDDQKHSLADLSEYDFIVVCFTCNTCPYSIDYEDRLIALHQRFVDDKTARVAVVAINSNDTPGDQIDKMKERAEQKEFPFLYLRDPDQEIAKQFKALYTPEFFVLDKQRALHYQGALDDKTKPNEVSQEFVVEVIEALKVGTEPPFTFQQPRGCKIRFSKPKRD
jgi:peroxiredoxin